MSRLCVLITAIAAMSGGRGLLEEDSEAMMAPVEDLIDASLMIQQGTALSSQQHSYQLLETDEAGAECRVAPPPVACVAGERAASIMKTTPASDRGRDASPEEKYDWSMLLSECAEELPLIPEPSQVSEMVDALVALNNRWDPELTKGFSFWNELFWNERERIDAQIRASAGAKDAYADLRTPLEATVTREQRDEERLKMRTRESRDRIVLALTNGVMQYMCMPIGLYDQFEPARAYAKVMECITLWAPAHHQPEFFLVFPEDKIKGALANFVWPEDTGPVQDEAKEYLKAEPTKVVPDAEAAAKKLRVAARYILWKKVEGEAQKRKNGTVARWAKAMKDLFKLRYGGVLHLPGLHPKSIRKWAMQTANAAVAAVAALGHNGKSSGA